MSLIGSTIFQCPFSVPFSEPDEMENPLEHTTYSPGQGPVRLPPIANTEGTPRQRKTAATERTATQQGILVRVQPWISTYDWLVSSVKIICVLIQVTQK